MSNCIRVLNINYDSNPYGGVSTFLMNVYRNIDHDKFKLDFLTPNTSSFNVYKKDIEKTGGNVFEFHIDPRSVKGKLIFGKKLKLFLKKRPYDIVHINCGVVSFDCVSALVAKSRGEKVIIHSHNAGGRKRWKNSIVFLLKTVMQQKADILCSCSYEAAQNVFTKQKINHDDIIFIKNGIDLQKFRFNREKRNKIRQEMNLKDKLVIGHIGRFEEQKNHEFLIDIFAEILKDSPTAVLFLIGQGELEDHIREKVRELELEDNVLFLGARNDVEDLYQVMDVLLFPSLYEGLPITLIEAQASGLPCCISDNISPEVDITRLIHRVSLNKSIKEWEKTTLALSDNQPQRRSYDQELMKAGYGIKATAEQISQIYYNIMTVK